MASRGSITSVNSDGSIIRRPAVEGQSESEEDKIIQAMDKEYTRLKAIWTQDKQDARLTIRTLQQQLADRDHDIAQLRTMLTNLQNMIGTRNRLIDDQQRRLQEMEARLTEQMRHVLQLATRNAQLVRFYGKIRGMLADIPDTVQPPQDAQLHVEFPANDPPVDAAIPTVAMIPEVVAPKGDPVAVDDDAPEVPVETIGEHVEIDTEPTAVLQPLPAANDTASSSAVGECVGDDTRSTDQSAQLPAAAHAPNAELSKKFGLARRSRASTDLPATVANRVGWERSRTDQGTVAADPGKRRRRLYPCGTVGCPRVFRNEPCKRRHEAMDHTEKPQLHSAK
ncbi:uncharacterized protein LOC129598394 isoform X2 [Paramacrobiotus metropolitanus]|uniref:uncharacterized protein LOC129598394 isoform X2 n=1 Tax=Paramacrobiotus metropolitanus TaxID=2943436 RepID=UPI002445A734|nr:uncharacterized protein LOC129598394 isoform X2 [Paramacrobiotus metropolitanus]